jgi:hypothetical protein
MLTPEQASALAVRAMCVDLASWATEVADGADFINLAELIGVSECIPRGGADSC